MRSTWLDGKLLLEFDFLKTVLCNENTGRHGLHILKFTYYPLLHSNDNKF